jgi:hypothetical protein
MFRASCDSDGWNLVVNKEKPYPTFFHILPASQIISVEVTGDITVRSVLAHIAFLKLITAVSFFGRIFNFNFSYCFSYVGFGAKNMVFAPPVGFNLTFVCPPGQVFESDWLATPFVMMTCQVKKNIAVCRPVSPRRNTFLGE